MKSKKALGKDKKRPKKKLIKRPKEKLKKEKKIKPKDLNLAIGSRFFNTES